MNMLERLEHLSKEKDINNNHRLAELSGVPYTTIDNFYRIGYDNIKLTTLQKLADFFNCSIDYLLGDSEERAKWSDIEKLKQPVSQSDGLSMVQAKVIKFVRETKDERKLDKIIKALALVFPEDFE